MLEQTFIHLPNFGPARERKLWRQGVRSWDSFINRYEPSRYHRELCMRLFASKQALKEQDASFFGRCLPRNEAWRCVDHFPKIAFLDIETTGLSRDGDYMTVAAIFDGKQTKSYVHGENLDDLKTDLEQFPAVATFNGSLFDIPFIEKSMPGIRTPPIHIDLRFVLASLGERGGLKKIEKRFGLEREDDLKDLNGYDAVLLWKKYIEKKDPDALDVLIRYNSADVSNLKVLLDWAYKEKRKECGIDS
jgi:hypothetical protein